MSFCCADCVYMNLKKTNSDGECYCGERQCYYPPSDPTCWSFKERESGGGCYLTTLVVNTLGYDDNCDFLKTLRSFRDNVMRKNPKYQDLLMEYDSLGPKLVKCIEAEADEQKLFLAELMKNKYIIPVCESLKHENNDKAVTEYKAMVLYLKKYYKEKLLALA